jgi:hypothetical protein
MECDPDELTNLVGLDSHRAVADVMRDRLVRRMTEVGEQAPAIQSAPARHGGQRIVAAAEVRA